MIDLAKFFSREHSPADIEAAIAENVAALETARADVSAAQASRRELLESGADDSALDRVDASLAAALRASDRCEAADRRLQSEITSARERERRGEWQRKRDSAEAAQSRGVELLGRARELIEELSTIAAAILAIEQAVQSSHRASEKLGLPLLGGPYRAANWRGVLLRDWFRP